MDEATEMLLEHLDHLLKVIDGEVESSKSPEQLARYIRKSYHPTDAGSAREFSGLMTDAIECLRNGWTSEAKTAIRHLKSEWASWD